MSEGNGNDDRVQVHVHTPAQGVPIRIPVHHHREPKGERATRWLEAGAASAVIIAALVGFAFFFARQSALDAANCRIDTLEHSESSQTTDIAVIKTNVRWIVMSLSGKQSPPPPEPNQKEPQP